MQQRVAFLIVLVIMQSAKANIETRPVVESHTKTEHGVRFNVETVDALGPRLQPRGPNAQQIARNFYDYEERHFASLEASSFTKADAPPLASSSGSFYNAALKAFADHYPLVIRPDDIWILQAYGFATHVDKNAEALRSRFVKHQGKKRLTVEVGLTPGASPPEEWERQVFPDFSRQIREHIGEETHKMIATGFSSTTTPTDQAAYEITLMTAMKHYFAYGMVTCCGIPWIELRGTLQDWQALRDRSQKMWGEFMPDYAEVLVPVLDQFIDAYQGKVDHAFWQSMVKRVQHGAGSGATTISGWVTLLYPYLAGGKNTHLRQWQHMYTHYGPDPDDFPKVVSSVPVEWDHFGEQILLHFHAGAFGYTQDPETLALSSHTGWVVSRDPPTSPEKRIAEIERQLADLAASGQNDRQAKHWRHRLTEELAKLKK